jgi:ankyrin repeat protein
MTVLSRLSVVILIGSIACGAPPPTPLAAAAAAGRTDAVLSMLRADPRQACEALTWAARGDQPAVIAALAARGARPDDCRAGVNSWTPLLHAIHKNQTAAVEALILAGADVNRAPRGGATPLMMAVGNGQLRITRALLDAGADPRAATEAGATVFSIAVSGGALTDIERPILGGCHTEIVRELLRRAPDLTLPRTVHGRLAQWNAWFNGCEEVSQIVARREAARR